MRSESDVGQNVRWCLACNVFVFGLDGHRRLIAIEMSSKVRPDPERSQEAMTAAWPAGRGANVRECAPRELIVRRTVRTEARLLLHEAGVPMIRQMGAVVRRSTSGGGRSGPRRLGADAGEKFEVSWIARRTVAYARCEMRGCTLQFTEGA